MVGIADGTLSGTVRGMFAAIDAADWEALERCFHPDVVYERPGLEPLVGRDRLLRYYREERPIVRGRHDLEHVVVQDGAGASWGRLEAVLADGTEAAEGFADVYEFADGLIRRRRTHFFRPAL